MTGLDSQNRWQLQPGEQALTCPGFPLLLRAMHGECAPQPTGTHHLAPFALREWADYRLVGDPALMERMSVRVNRQHILTDPDGPFWPIIFQNQIGKSVLQVTVDGRPLPLLTIEVLSNKFPTPAGHLSFYRGLLDDLVALNARLPFTFEAPTGHFVEESAQPPSPLFVYHFLRQHHRALSTALEMILHAPHRVLCDDERIVPVSQVADVNPVVVDWIVAHPEEWQRAPHVAVSRHLSGYAPARVWQSMAEETYDTPPNRFTRHFVREMAQRLADPALAPFAAGLGSARGVMEDALRSRILDEVGDMHRFPSESQVLLKRDGYRELLHLWRLFHLARRPFFGPLQEAIDSRNIAALYEFWCFFALVDRLQASFGPAMLRMAVTDVHGLAYKAEACFEQSSRRLVYNQEFGQRIDRSGSYSVPLRPDFTLMEGRRVVCVFDAKFRFDPQDLGGEEDRYDDDVAARDVTRIVKRADLYKMHTYRDALHAQSAVALYPGDEAIFYDADRHQTCHPVLAGLVGAQGCAGIGALPFRPLAQSVPANK